ncbi:MAG: DUF11 domain-containing protein [Oscillospiraceae bacterium]|jgi:uncharacterized repeat protein (TIGR01451 family)|nr:DUF11 domain-containing protein [Oscillospiraceae bacterium]
MSEKQTDPNTNLSPFKVGATATGSVTVQENENPQSIQAISNVIITDVVKAVVKESADKEFADNGERIKYTITLQNDSSVDLYDVKIISELCYKTTLVKSSIIPTPQLDETLETGISVTSPNETSTGSVPKGTSAVLQYEVTVNEGETGDMVNESIAEIKFRDQTGNEYTGKTEPSMAVTNIAKADLQITETADKTFVTENNEEIVFELTIKNTGNVPINDVVVINPLPDGMNYKPNSTLKNDTKALSDENPANSINIGILDPEQIYKIQFSVTVNL